MQISLKISKVRYELFQYVKKFAFPEIFLSLCFFFHLQVHSHVDIYNFSDNTWGGRFDMPKDMAHSHLGMVTDGRFIYVVTGQYGPQCIYRLLALEKLLPFWSLAPSMQILCLNIWPTCSL